MPVTSGLSDFNRRLTVLSPTTSDSGFYECEATLRSSSVPSVSAGAYLHVLGREGDEGVGPRARGGGVIER